MNLATLVIYVPMLAYYLYSMIHLSSFLNDPAYSRDALNEFIKQISETTSSMMFISAITIWTSFIFMRRMLISSANLQGSQYKQKLQRGFFIIGLAYSVLTIYSLLYLFNIVYPLEVVVQKFTSLMLQMIVNFVMDLSSILSVLLLHRGTIKMRRLLT